MSRSFTSRSFTQRIRAFALLVLCVQYAIVGIVGWHASEPWPAVVLPGFKSVYEEEGVVTVQVPRFVAHLSDGDTTSVPTSAVLALLPRSHHTSFLRAQCHPASLSGATRTEVCQHPDGATWLADRVQAHVLDRPVARIDIVWERIEIRRGDRRGISTHRTPLDTLTVTASSGLHASSLQEGRLHPRPVGVGVGSAPPS